MGVYLSKPKTEKESDYGGNRTSGTTSFGLTSMQGWRQTMEDSHLALPHVKELEELLDGREVSLYGVFDGHGGPAVSEWIARHMVNVLARELKATRENPPAELPTHFEKDIILLSESLCKTFIELDEEMQTEGNLDEIRQLNDMLTAKGAATADDDQHDTDDDDDNDPSDTAGGLRTLLNKQGQTVLKAILGGNSNRSSMIKLIEQNGEQFFQITTAEDGDTPAADGEDDAGDTREGTVIEEIRVGDIVPEPEQGKEADDEAEHDKDSDASKKDLPEASPQRKDSAASRESSEKKGVKPEDIVEDAHVTAPELKSPRLASEVVEAATSTASKVPPVESILQTAEHHLEGAAGSGESTEVNVGGSGEENAPELHAQVSTDAWTSGGTSTRPPVPDTCGAAVVLTAIVGGEKPFLVTANAGDSRCVLCRGGVAVAQSHDHKPHLYHELNRIVRAGGYIEHGRVDGNLNLSRTLGDLFYKRNKTLKPEQQKITAYPDVIITGITPEDQFIIIACDGIWDCLTNQQACEFVLSRLGDNPTPQHLSAICEEMCDTCLAGHPMDSEGGIGCDNMTCIIVLLNDDFRARGIRGSNSAYYKKPE